MTRPGTRPSANIPAGASFLFEQLAERLLEAEMPAKQMAVLVDSYYGLIRGLSTRADLADTEARIDERFNLVNERFDAVDRKFDAVNERFDAVDRKFDAIDKKFDAIDKKFDAIDRKFDAVNEKILASENNLRKEIQLRFELLDHKIRFGSKVLYVFLSVLLSGVVGMSGLLVKVAFFPPLLH